MNPGRPRSPRSNALRVLFIGSPEFALPSLRALCDVGRIVAVVTQPDKPAGRGRRVRPTPVAAEARRLGLRVLQPTRLRRPEVVEEVRALAPDLIVTVAYGRIIPPEVLDVPPLGAINAHPSLLPKYRGASPIEAAVAAGETATGVTILFQTEELDAGDIILQERLPIGSEETAGELEGRLAEVSARLLAEAVRLIAEGRAPRRPQDHAAATYVGRLTKEDGRIDWGRSAAAIVNHIRAMAPWPSAYTFREGRRLKIWTARPEPSAGAAEPGTEEPAEPGTVLAVDREGIRVVAADGVVRVLELQPEDGRRMAAAEFARGHQVRPGERWAPTAT